MIKKLIVKNFKSFKLIECNLSSLNVLIGPNSSGKSNFVSIFQFLKDISKEGFQNAVSLQGGGEFISNFNSSIDEPVTIEVHIEQSSRIGFNESDKKEPNFFNYSNMNYKVELFFNRSKKLKKYKETLSFKEEKGKSSTINKMKDENSNYSSITIVNDNGKITQSKPVMGISEFFVKMRRQTYIGSIMNTFPFQIISNNFFSHIQTYDFDPKLSKKAIPMSGLAELESNGNNTALVLEKLIEDKHEREKFIRFLKICLPFIKDIKIEKQIDKSILFKIDENFNPKKSIPASLISDGTIETISIIYALFFDNKKLILLEEPERNVHPHIISKIMQLVKEASEKKQILLTTHSPELLKYVQIEDIFLLERDGDGNSTISKPNEVKEIKLFLDNNIGLSELFVDGFIS
ncbi:MAG: AAA family ATPase [Thermoplasmataceae archaeon]